MTNEAMATIQERFKPVLARFLGSNTIAKLQNGDLTIEQYRSIMRQIFHHTRENPQLQALATVHFRGHQRKAIKRFYRHASSEIGHDQLALNDYKTLDGDPAAVPYENPLPATLGVLSFGFYQIYNLNHLGYLG